MGVGRRSGHKAGLSIARHGRRWWRSGESLHRLLAQLAAEWWVAEETDSGRLIGYARTLERDGLFELTEFFVQPEAQGKGLGRALLDGAFPASRGAVRWIIATSDVRAQAGPVLRCGHGRTFPDLLTSRRHPPG